ncbi:MAG: ZIP family metal transporter [Trueperaceae bacterium]|nr:ZIP family metal transporter [Trueperaceae bacterium]
MPVLDVFLYALITALATGLGALPFLFVREMPERLLGLGNAVAAGLMLAASFRLVTEGLTYNAPRLVIGVLIGLVLIVVAQRWLSSYEHLNVGQLEGAGALKALLIVGVMTIHSFAEGVGVGVSFGDSLNFGLFVTIAISVHNIPEGLAISLILIPQGVTVWRAAFWSVVSSLPQPLVAVPAFLFVATFEPFLPVGLGLAAGAMIWMATAELLPDALENAPKEQIATTLTVAVAFMVALQAWLR